MFDRKSGAVKHFSELDCVDDASAMEAATAYGLKTTDSDEVELWLLDRLVKRFG